MFAKKSFHDLSHTYLLFRIYAIAYLAWLFFVCGAPRAMAEFMICRFLVMPCMEFIAERLHHRRQMRGGLGGGASPPHP